MIRVCSWNLGSKSPFLWILHFNLYFSLKKNIKAFHSISGICCGQYDNIANSNPQMKIATPSFSADSKIHLHKQLQLCNKSLQIILLRECRIYRIIDLLPLYCIIYRMKSYRPLLEYTISGQFYVHYCTHLWMYKDNQLTKLSNLIQCISNLH